MCLKDSSNSGLLEQKPSWYIQPKNYVQSDTEASLLWITSL